MFSLISLILVFLNILTAILLLVMAGVVIILLLIIFLIIAIVVGLKEKSIFKGLKLFVIASSILTISPTVMYLFAYKFDSIFPLSSNQLLLVGGIIGLLISILFGVFSFNVFEKIAKKAHGYISKKKMAE